MSIKKKVRENNEYYYQLATLTESKSALNFIFYYTSYYNITFTRYFDVL